MWSSRWRLYYEREFEGTTHKKINKTAKSCVVEASIFRYFYYCSLPYTTFPRWPVSTPLSLVSFCMKNSKSCFFWGPTMKRQNEIQRKMQCAWRRLHRCTNGPNLKADMEPSVTFRGIYSGNFLLKHKNTVEAYKATQAVALSISKQKSLSKQAEKQSPGGNMKDREEPFLRKCRDRTRGNDFNLNAGGFRLDIRKNSSRWGQIMA